MIQIRPAFYFVVASAIFLLFFIFSSGTSVYQSTGEGGVFWGTKTKATNGVGAAINNKTLGFGKIYSINLPERTDKRDAQTLAASYTNLKIDFMKGVKGSEVPDKAVPFGTNRSLIWETNVGSWRGHMNAIRTIVEEPLGSALIIEDDVDWDLTVHQQLQQFSQAAMHLQVPNSVQNEDNPYGTEWDLLWLGHCGEHFPETIEPKLEDPDLRKFVIENDPTVPSFNHVSGFVDWKSYKEHTRFVHTTGGPICTFGYALSHEGARKVLYNLSIKGLGGIFDNVLSDMCRYQIFGFRCISVNPTFMYHHKPRGYLAAESDIRKYGPGGEIREVGFTENVVYSTRLNLENMVQGLKPVPQWDD
ncbi:MAG: hypothetical protein M1834_006871 [Cirrosporium novae-zelandiae]|nr:MAG: hypothetical protein M1834_006871 [Cirrosporium novae-zelandiae]